MSKNQPDPIGDYLYRTENVCYRTHVEFDWDQWTRTRLVCDHGTFEAVSSFMNITEGFERALAKFLAYPHPAHCYKDTPIPESWVSSLPDDGTGWKPGDTSECDLFVGHEGPCRIYEDNTEEDAIRNTRR